MPGISIFDDHRESPMLRRPARILLASVAAVGLLSAVQAPPASAAQQTTSFYVGGYLCPSGVYDIVAVQVTGTFSAPSINAWWSGSANPTVGARVTVYGIPYSGGRGHVVVGYRCKIKLGWWVWPSSAKAVAADRWFYGSGYQPGIWM